MSSESYEGNFKKKVFLTGHCPEIINRLALIHNR